MISSPGFDRSVADNLNALPLIAPIDGARDETGTRHRTRATAVAAATMPVAPPEQRTIWSDPPGPLAAAGGFAGVGPDEPTAHGCIVAVRAHVPGSATRMRWMAVESGRNVPRAANPGRPGMEATRANETMMRAVVAFVGRAV